MATPGRSASASAKVCRLCRALVSTKRLWSLFSSAGVSSRLASRISSLLGVSVSRKDGLPAQICTHCNNRLVKLEKALGDLATFKEMAQCSVAAFTGRRQPVKRTKETGSDVGVSPDTLRERPRSKQVRRRLPFECKKKFGLKYTPLIIPRTHPPLLRSSNAVRCYW